MTTWIVIAVLVLLVAVAGGLTVQRGLDRRSDGRQGDGPTAEELRGIARDIDRGRGAGQGFFP